MKELTDEYFQTLENKIKNGTVTEEDDIEYQENVEKVYKELKKWTFRIFYGSLVSIIIGISLIIAYFHFYESEFDTESTKIIYFFISGLALLGIGTYCSYFSYNKMNEITIMNEEFSIEEDED